MTTVADASSIILLSKIGLLKTATNELGIVIPKRVYDEALAGKEKGRLDAIETEKLASDKKITVVEPGEKEKDEVKKIFLATLLAIIPTKLFGTMILMVREWRKRSSFEVVQNPEISI